MSTSVSNPKDKLNKAKEKNDGSATNGKDASEDFALKQKDSKTDTLEPIEPWLIWLEVGLLFFNAWVFKFVPRCGMLLAVFFGALTTLMSVVRLVIPFLTEKADQDRFQSYDLRLRRVSYAATALVILSCTFF